MEFTKYQALGNDYLVIDPGHVDFEPTYESVRLLCDRHFGVGADGILFGPIGPVRPGDPVRLRIFNSDGTECEKSGNGLRMFALYTATRYPVGDRFVIHTLAGDSPVWVRDLASGVVEVDMGRPRIEAVSEPLDVDGRRLGVTRVDIGNPHTVVPAAAISRDLACELGPRIARHPTFPEGSNVQFMKVVDDGVIEIEIWERGAGYTLASGSSSCAAAAAAHVLGLVGDAVEVRMPGGTIAITFRPDGAVTMVGPAQEVATGRLADAFQARLATC